MDHCKGLTISLSRIVRVTGSPLQPNEDIVTCLTCKMCGRIPANPLQCLACGAVVCSSKAFSRRTCRKSTSGRHQFGSLSSTLKASMNSLLIECRYGCRTVFTGRDSLIEHERVCKLLKKPDFRTPIRLQFEEAEYLIASLLNSQEDQLSEASTEEGSVMLEQAPRKIFPTELFWQCLDCGYHNKRFRGDCNHCGKEKADSDVEEDGEGFCFVKERTKKWTCEGCDLKNDGAREACYGCEAACSK